MKISLILGLSLLTALGTSNAFAQMPALEEQQQEQIPPAAQQQQQTGGGEEQQPNLSFGKVTIPVSSGEQIILEVPLQDGNSYKLVPIK